MKAQDLIVKLTFLGDKKEIEQVDTVVTRLKSNLKIANRNFRELALGAQKAGVKLTKSVSKPILEVAKTLVDAASEAEQVKTKYKQVFGEISKEANKSASTLVKNYGMSRVGAKELLADTGAVFKNFGLGKEASLKLSEQVSRLAVDFSSYTNSSLSAKEAGDILARAVLGESEALKGLGIQLQEGEIKQQMAANAAKGLAFENEKQAKAFAALSLVQQKSAHVVDHYANTQGEADSKLQLLKKRTNDLAVEFGGHLLPIYKKLLDAALKVVEWFSNLSDESKKTILVIAGIVAAIGPLLAVFGSLGLVVQGAGVAFGVFMSVLSGVMRFGRGTAGVISFLWKNFGRILLRGTKITAFFGLAKAAAIKLAVAFAGLNASVLLIPLAIAAIIGLVALLVKDFIAWKNGQDSFLGDMLGSWSEFIEVIDLVVEVLKLLATIVVDSVVAAWDKFVGLIKQVVNWFKELFKSFVELFVPWESFTALIDAVAESFSNFFGGMIEKIQTAIDSVAEFFSKIADSGPLKTVLSFVRKFTNEDESSDDERSFLGKTRDLLASQLPQQIPANAVPAVSRSTSQNVNVKSEIKLAIPEGTTAQQRQFIEQAAHEYFSDGFGRALNGLQAEAPLTE